MKFDPHTTPGVR